jgi:hypothetical protein
VEGDGSVEEMVTIGGTSRVPSEADRLLRCWEGVGWESLLMLARRATDLDGDWVGDWGGGW